MQQIYKFKRFWCIYLPFCLPISVTNVFKRFMNWQYFGGQIFMLIFCAQINSREFYVHYRCTCHWKCLFGCSLNKLYGDFTPKSPHILEVKCKNSYRSSEYECSYIPQFPWLQMELDHLNTMTCPTTTHIV